MPLNVGSPEKKTGMAYAIYQTIDARHAEFMGEVSSEDLEKARKVWQTLSCAIADGVVRYILKNDPLENTPITLPEYAETFSSATEDPGFWTWFAAFIQILKAWTDNAAADPLILHSELKSLFEDSTNPVPTELKGIIT